MKTFREKIVNKFIIGTFVSLYLLVSIISTIHSIDFFELSNPRWMAITLAIGFEIGAAASLASIIVMEKMNKTLVWTMFIIITAMQINGNLYYAFTNMDNYDTWSQLFNITEWKVLEQKRLLAAVSGAILPLVALGFIKSLVDYIRPETKINNKINKEDTNTKKETQESEQSNETLQKEFNKELEKEEFEDWDVTLEDGLEDFEQENSGIADMQNKNVKKYDHNSKRFK